MHHRIIKILRWQIQESFDPIRLRTSIIDVPKQEHSEVSLSRRRCAAAHYVSLRATFDCEGYNRQIWNNWFPHDILDIFYQMMIGLKIDASLLYRTVDLMASMRIKWHRLLRWSEIACINIVGRCGCASLLLGIYVLLHQRTNINVICGYAQVVG